MSSNGFRIGFVLSIASSTRTCLCLWLWLNVLSIFVLATSSETGWRPLKSRPDFIIGPRIIYATKKLPSHIQTCSLYKAAMDQHSFHQYIQYKHHIPDMKEFTLCAWHKLYNYSSNHPIFSYALPRKPRTILSWIMNTPKKRSYYMFAVNGHIIYRINYPIKLHKWYHMCQSWNGKTGEWQLWVDDERVARGYYNLMVGKLIKSGGIAITGQEHSDLGGSFKWNEKGFGLQGEVTLVQLYKAALSRGKAYSDHKHHHVHQWSGGDEESDGDNNSDGEDNGEQDDESTKDAQFGNDDGGSADNTGFDHPFLENGQLKPQLEVHQMLAKPLMTSDTLYNLEFFSPIKRIQKSLDFFDNSTRAKRDVLVEGVEVKKQNLRRRRRVHSGVNEMMGSIHRADVKRDDHWLQLKTTSRTQNYERRKVSQRKSDNKVANAAQNDRSLLITDNFLPPLSWPFPSSIAGAPGLRAATTIFSELEGHDVLVNGTWLDTAAPHEQELKIEFEPAEWEVKKIGAICGGCDEDPFRKANVLSWQETPKKLFAGAQYIPAIPKCYIF